MSFYTGISGLRAAQKDLGVVGNNIANASTKGFKQSRAEFGDMYNTAMLGGSGKNQVGSGVLLERVSQQHTQGNFDYTERSLDMAIRGNGYFILDNNGQTEYTRAGYFDLDEQGFVVNNTGKRLQGYAADARGVITGGSLGDIQVTMSSLEPKATSNIRIDMNLDARSSVYITDPEDEDYRPLNPKDISTFAGVNHTPVFDNFGTEHTLTQYFVKTGEDKETGNSWSVLNAFDGQFFAQGGTPLYINTADEGADANWQPLTAENWDPSSQVALDNEGGNTQALEDYLAGSLGVDGAAVPENSLVQSEFQFKPDGKFGGFAADGGELNPRNPLNIEIPDDFITPGAWIGANAGENIIEYNLSNTTQYSGKQSVLAQSQDGYATGNLTGLEVAKDGTIVAIYSNSHKLNVGEVPLATFTSPVNLQPNGSTTWVETVESGEPAIGKAGSGNKGGIIGRALEESNVDIAEELVKMIIGQRNYQANAKTIQTQDAITQTIINMR